MRLKIRVRSYDLEMLGERSREISYGELAHQALYFLEPLPPGYHLKELKPALKKAIDRALALADPRFREEFAQARDFLFRVLARALSLKEVKPFFAQGVKALCEQEFQDEAGQLHRLDRLVFLGDELVLLEYKLGGRRRAHWEQVGLYQKVLTEIFGKRPRSYLFYLEEPALVDVDRVHQRPLL